MCGWSLARAHPLFWDYVLGPVSQFVQKCKKNVVEKITPPGHPHFSNASSQPDCKLRNLNLPLKNSNTYGFYFFKMCLASDCKILWNFEIIESYQSIWIIYNLKFTPCGLKLKILAKMLMCFLIPTVNGAFSIFWHNSKNSIFFI